MNDIFIQIKKCAFANLDLHAFIFFCWSKQMNDIIYINEPKSSSNTNRMRENYYKSQSYIVYF